MRMSAGSLAVALSVSVLLLGGCGTGTVPVVSLPGAAANLSGNWLLAGSLPVMPTVPGASPAFGLAATFDVAGQQVTGIVNGTLTCGGLTSVLPVGTVTGTVASDGSFTLATPTAMGVTNPMTVTIQGHTPASSGGAWSGAYTVTTASGCVVTPASGAVTATSIALVSGSYNGTVAVNNALSALSLQVPVKVSLQQGGTITSVAGVSLQTNLLLTGSIALTGSNCLTGGVTGTVTTTTVPGTVEGTTVLANFTMNDGSKAELLGTIAASDASKINGVLFTTTTGSCSQNLFSLVAIPLTH